MSSGLEQQEHALHDQLSSQAPLTTARNADNNSDTSNNRGLMEYFDKQHESESSPSALLPSPATTPEIVPSGITPGSNGGNTSAPTAFYKPRPRAITKPTDTHVRRLSASKIQELTSSPKSLPIAAVPDHPLSASAAEHDTITERLDNTEKSLRRDFPQDILSDDPYTGRQRPNEPSRTSSTPPTSRRKSKSATHQERHLSFQPTLRPPPLHLNSSRNNGHAELVRTQPLPSPSPATIPLPPLSLPTLLQLELAAQRPSPLYIHHSHLADSPYESSAIKFERLKNFLMLPQYLERTLIFGTLACLDAWLWTFTILPVRFIAAIGVLARWWAYVIHAEARWLTSFVWGGLGRLWQRRSRPAAQRGDSTSSINSRTQSFQGKSQYMPRGHKSRHRRTRSTPSNLSSFHKADLLQGAIVVCSVVALMNLDASRIYHFIRAQSAVKLYVIYNLVEVGDRLLSAVGQDIFECLFSTEMLSRNTSGRSKILLPFGMFLLTLVYNCSHVVVLFYQVITLNVAVNSYSNALLTLLMSNQFVEIKSAVFKRFEKENTFQLTCADIVERFQLWILLFIIGMRNLVEVGGLSIPGAGTELGDDGFPTSTSSPQGSSMLPASFTMLPNWMWSGEMLSPFLIVIGSEMIVDWIKHAYINKFNNIKPNFYGRILDILCKDYYTNAFVTPSLTRRLGLPLLPLSCLFIRAAFQTYHMFLASHIPATTLLSTQTSLSVESATPTSPAVTAALENLDRVIRNALGRSVHGVPFNSTMEDSKKIWIFSYNADDLIAVLTMVVVFFIAFLVLLILKLLLGMALLRYSRDRYARMKVKEQAVAAGQTPRENFIHQGSKRVGGYGHVEVGEARRAWIYGEDTNGLRKSREREKRADDKRQKDDDKDLASINRYEMVAKRIW